MTTGRTAPEMPLDGRPAPARRIHGFGEVIPPVRVVGRILECQECHTDVDVLEAAFGAGPLDDPRHQWIVPEEYVCGDCQFAGGAVEVIADEGEVS